MHLCLACRDVVRDAPSGLVRATCELAEALADAGHHVELLTDLSASAAPELLGVTVRRLAVIPLSDPPADVAPETALHNLMHAAAIYREVKRIHEHEQPVDAVLAPLWRSLGALCVLDERFPTIVSCMTSLRTLTEIDPRYEAIPDIRERLTLERETLARSEYLHGLTSASLAKTIDDYDLAPAQTAVVGRGVRDRWPVGEVTDHGPSEILFVGRIELRKGLDTLLLAARELIDSEVQVRFTIVGPESDPGLVAAFAEAMTLRPQLEESVRFTGVVSDAELWSLYERAAIVCVPSRYESHGVVPLEAMMFGKPIVTCSTGGIPEVVIPERTALIVAPDDGVALAAALRRLVDDPKLRGRLGEAGRKLYERRFESGVVAAEMQAFIERVVAAHQGRGHRVAGDAGADDVDGARDAAGVAGVDRIQQQLEELLRSVLVIESEPATAVAAQLLDPFARGPLHQIRRLALSTPAPPLKRPGARTTAVILTRDRPDLLRRALDSVASSSADPEILVIDDGSRPRAAQRVAAECAGRAGVQLHRSDRKLGCGPGRCLGAELAEGELILFLDDDAELMPGALEHLLAELEAHPDVGAVTATVVDSDARVVHSGGSVAVDGDIATYSLIGAGSPLGIESLPPTGPAQWVPGTAVLIRRSLLQKIPLDERMIGYYEDNEWSYRVEAERPGSFRRSREALALHHLIPKRLDTGDLHAQSLWADWLTSLARFHERHGILLAPWLFDVVPELRAEDGSCDYAGGRLLLELVSAKGRDWLLSARINGDLDDFLSARRHRIEHAELIRLREAVSAQEDALAFLHRRHETLTAIEQGGWWRLRGRILPILKLASRFRESIAQRAG